MNRRTLLLTLAGATALLAQTPADLMTQFHHAQDNLSSILEKVKDEQTAQSSLPQVALAVAGLNEAKSKLKQVALNKSNTQHSNQVKGNEKQAQESTRRLVNQLTRISHDPALDGMLHTTLSKL